MNFIGSFIDLNYWLVYLISRIRMAADVSKTHSDQQTKNLWIYKNIKSWCENPFGSLTKTKMQFYFCRKNVLLILLTRLPRIWLIAALSFKVHSATTFALISFIYSIKAFKGFFMWGFFLSGEKKKQLAHVDLIPDFCIILILYKIKLQNYANYWDNVSSLFRMEITLIVLLTGILRFCVIRRERRRVFLIYRRPENSKETNINKTFRKRENSAI